MTKNIQLPHPSLTLLIGPSSAGKTTFAKKHLPATTVVSTDLLRSVLCDDENNQEISAQAFQIAEEIVRIRLDWKRATVVDAMNINPRGREFWKQLASQRQIPYYAIVFNTPDAVIRERFGFRQDRNFEIEVLESMLDRFHKFEEELDFEGFDKIWHVSPDDQIVIQLGH